MEAVVELTMCSSLSGTAGRLETFGMTLLGRPRRPLYLQIHSAVFAKKKSPV